MMATLTPARLLGVDDRIGRLKPGLRADLVPSDRRSSGGRGLGRAGAGSTEIEAAA